MNITNTSAIETATEFASTGITFYLKQFLNAPFLVGIISVFVILVLGLIAKQLLDNSETRGQMLVWDFIVHGLVFFITLMVLIFMDASEMMIQSKLF